MQITRLKPTDRNAIFVKLMWNEAQKHPWDGKWRKYEGTIQQADKKYRVTGEFVILDGLFSYKNIKCELIGREIIRVH